MIFIIFNVIVTAILTVVAGSFLEWFVHGPMMHGGFGLPYLRSTHQDHHKSYDNEVGYKNTEHGPHVHLPWWSMVVSVGFMAAIGWAISYWSGHWEVMWCVVLVTSVYYVAYQYVHTCLHVPTGRWFEKTRLCRFLDRHHQVHHARDEDFGRLINICVLCPIADYVMGTTLRHTKSK